MDRQYFDRYQFFNDNGEFRIVPGIEIPFKTTDKYHYFKKGKDRFDKLSEETYGSPVFGFLILLANPQVGGLEFEIPDNYLIRIPFPLISTLQDYKRNVELYNLYYGDK